MRTPHPGTLLLESTRRLLRAVQSDDAEAFASELAERQRCLDALAHRAPKRPTAEPVWVGELRALEAEIFTLAGEQLAATRDELARIRSARATVARGLSNEPTARFVSHRA